MGPQPFLYYEGSGISQTLCIGCRKLLTVQMVTGQHNLGKRLAGLIASPGPSCLSSLFIERAGPRMRDRVCVKSAPSSRGLRTTGITTPLRGSETLSRILQMERDYLVESRRWLMVGLSLLQDGRNVPSAASSSGERAGVDGGIS